MKNWGMDQVLNNIPFPIWIKDLGKNTKYTNYEFNKLYKIKKRIAKLFVINVLVRNCAMTQ
ncbi:hypothetical protein H8697_09050 [[Eubacterium] tenue]|nr:hypothetical protein [[Eubacterium] tenue]MBC8631849.1 hypothetical protein [[Eubacterium] tenue]